MLGQLKFSGGAWGGAEWGRLYGLPVLRAQTDPEGLLGELRLRRAGRTLRRGGALRTLVPEGFEAWPLLEGCGLVPVDPAPLIREESADLALEALRRQGRAPERAVVALRGLRADRDMERTAAELCGRVRHLVITAPRGGKELALWLHREYGVPVLPPEEGAQVALCFDEGVLPVSEERLELYGHTPYLAGLRLTAPELEREDRGDLSLLSALWEGGKLGKGDLKIT